MQLKRSIIRRLKKYLFKVEIVVAKGNRVIITLECTEAKKLGKSPSRYTTTKNKKNTPDRIELKKYNPFLRKHTIHKEIK